MQEFIFRLTERLRGKLPGEKAHQLMVPKLDGAARIRMKPGANVRRGAVMILLYQEDDQIKFPLIQRPVYDGVHSGQMALPGGKHDEGDHSLHFTALRETHEEVGVDPDTVKVIGQLSEFMVAASNHLVLPVVGYTDRVPDYVPQQSEVDEVIVASLEELLNPKNVKTKLITTTHGYQLQSPYYDLQGKVVWGATAMMLSEFVAILKEL